jgi:hypothetical protein
MTEVPDGHWRISLSPFDACDPQEEITWLPEAWAAIDGRKPDAHAPSTATNLIEAAGRRWPDARIDRIDIAPRDFAGYIIWETTQREIAIRGVSIRRDQRNLGYGGEAVEWLEASWPDCRFVAAVPRKNGLAVYFWLRVGFRPVREDENQARSRDPDFLWMLRAEPATTTAVTSDP